MAGFVEERRAAGSMAGRKDDLYLTTAKVYHFTVVEILDLSLVVAHVILNDRHVTGIHVNLREGPYPARMVTVGMRQHHRDRLGSNLGYNLVQSRNDRSCVNQECTVVTLDKVERLIIDSVSVAYPCMVVKLTEHHFVILINHLAAQVTTVNL